MSDDQFGGHEFCYESSTDLFRCVICRVYEVVVVDRSDGSVKPCEGPQPGDPMELNGF